MAQKYCGKYTAQTSQSVAECSLEALVELLGHRSVDVVTVESPHRLLTALITAPRLAYLVIAFSNGGFRMLIIIPNPAIFPAGHSQVTAPLGAVP
ncbi:hypothetical protein PsYK624_095820 [Phanerochaete sordida]|uniref:Uncharacterized protein n=1 Tax=Phanerochaete sordida TaxID=48140 RepID=A0A9P3GC72_9APHY|nr:hypothetical protein PsYK624_095820 [Phanerochaete sordida]